MKRIMKRVISIALVLTCVFALAVSTSATQKYINMQGRYSYTSKVQIKNDINQYNKWISVYNSGKKDMWVCVYNVNGRCIKNFSVKSGRQVDVCVGTIKDYTAKNTVKTYTVVIQPINGTTRNTNWVTIKTNSWAPIK